MKKGSFFICKKVEGKIVAELRTGYLDLLENIAYYRDNNGNWSATDIPTGLFIKAGRTRKELETELSKMLNWLDMYRKSDVYKKQCSFFAELIPQKEGDTQCPHTRNPYANKTAG